VAISRGPRSRFGRRTAGEGIRPRRLTARPGAPCGHRAGRRTTTGPARRRIERLRREVDGLRRELKGFRKVVLAPGESRKVVFTLRPRDLAFVGLDNRWVTEPGRFRLSVGGLTRDFTYR